MQLGMWIGNAIDFSTPASKEKSVKIAEEEQQKLY